MTLLDTLLADVDAFVFDFDGTVASGEPYERTLREIAVIADVPYDGLYARYEQEWHGIEEAEAFHLANCKPEHVRQIRAAYRQFKDARDRVAPIPGAIRVLLHLVDAGRPRICWTRGDEHLQHQAIRRSGLEQFFEPTIVTPVKTRDTVLHQLVPALCGARFALIGDSYSHDIVPAEGIAAKRVWVSESDANAYHAKKPSPTSDVIVIATVADLLTPMA